ncbi:MAG TPA: permease [Vicinamibacterales bacterium]|nr:permease [Vicinamibacterales bacterium]
MTERGAYRAALSGFVGFLALTLLTIVDIRRGFLFAAYRIRTPYIVLTPVHAVMLAMGIAGAAVCWRRLAALERRVPPASRAVRPFGFTILALLIVDLFTYRGVPAARSIAAGRIGVDWLNAFGVVGWLRPAAQASSYLLNVWHATMIGILISGLTLTVLAGWLGAFLVRDGFTGSLAGAAFALPQPFCSCCSSVMAPSFVRRGASTNFILSFVIGAPMLNITTIILAVALLPASFAALRIAAGVVIAVVVTYAIAAMFPRTLPATPQRWFTGLDPERVLGSRPVETPSQLVAAWLRASGRIALVLVPTLWIWSVGAALVFQAMPAAFGNNLPSVVIAAIAGTFFMISTWSEIPMALTLIQSGFTGPAAALLVVLPAISLPCMVLLGGSLQRFRLVAALSAAVMVIGIAAGAMFL